MGGVFGRYVYEMGEPENAPSEPAYIELEFEKGDPVALNGERLSPAEMLTALNKPGR